ncbi:acetate uptake transporter [Chryseobacterium sp. M5]|uniref:acetate uptake transporter n=1 Tax=Chryseobacterium sp. M5 TaxID=3379128 RepID=UPI003857C268
MLNKRKRNFQIQRVSNHLCNPAQLGLCAFGISTILLNIHNAGFFEMNAMILLIGIFYSGVGQIIAGIVESKKNNVFGFTAFTSFDFFWISLVSILIVPKLGIAVEADSTTMGFYLSCWGFFTLLLFFFCDFKNKHRSAVCLRISYHSLFLIISIGLSRQPIN